MKKEMVMWTIYDHPSDYPNSFVLREWLVLPDGQQPTGIVIRCDVIEPLRKQMLEAGLVCIPRSVDDDPKIVESWI